MGGESQNQPEDTVFSVSQEELQRAYSVQAILTNRFIAQMTPAGLRIAFAEQGTVGNPPIFHTAVVIPTWDAISLYKLIQKLTKDSEEFFAAAPKPESKNA